jgi:hypothetical protein
VRPTFDADKPAGRSMLPWSRSAGRTLVSTLIGFTFWCALEATRLPAHRHPNMSDSFSTAKLETL